MIRVAIVEDEEAIFLKHKEYINRYSKQMGEKFEVTWFSDGDEIASDYKPSFDIIFLDIQMKRLDGMKTAEYIRKLDKDVILIFITNMAQYAIRGYAVDAMDFLLKPVEYFPFAQQLKKSVEKISLRKASYLLIQTDKGVVRLNISDVLFVESEKHKITVHAKTEDYSFFGTMKDMEEKLCDGGGSKRFYRCNNGYLVNLEWVMGVQDSFAVVGKHNLQISRPKKKGFLEALAEYVGGVVK